MLLANRKLVLPNFLTGIFCLILLAICSIFPLLAYAQDTATETTPVEEVYVTAKRPGPALWQVTNGDNVLYIFGSLQPLPKDFDWDSARVDWVISQSQEFIEPIRVRSGPSNFISGVFAAREYSKLQKLTDDQTLSDLLTPELFADYLTLKELYAPENTGIEELRPFFVADTLNKEALKTLGLTTNGNIIEELLDIAQRHRVPITETTVSVPFSILLETLKQIPMETEIACLEHALATIDADVQSSVERARAWANGNSALLKQFDYPDVRNACYVPALTLNDTFNEAAETSKGLWTNAVISALENNESTVTVMSMRDLTHPDGLLAKLHSLGYRVVGQ